MGGCMTGFQFIYKVYLVLHNVLPSYTGSLLGPRMRVCEVIYQTRGRVFHQDIETPRSVLKNQAVDRVF